ncbi:MAG: caspase family protein [Myxococcota bacterium]
MAAPALAILGALALLIGSAAPAAASRKFGGDGTTLKGKYRAVIAWVQDYDEWTPLSAPKKDAEGLAKVLVERYLFAPEDVEVVANPTQAELFKAVKGAAVKAEEGDSLLIVFAGHGYLEKETDQGYWIPKDGKRPGPAAELTYLSSSWVRDVLKGSKALHVALVSDSCFSGALLGGTRGDRGVIDDTYYGKAYLRRSFEGLTSGALETVDDAGAPGGHSPFAYYLASALEKPDEPVFDLQDVFQRVRSGVKELSKQSPLFGKIAGAPSDGGAFVFVARDGLATGAGGKADAAPSGPTPTPGEPVATRSYTPTDPTADALAAVQRAFDEGKYGDALKVLLKSKLCEGGHAVACNTLGTIYEQGLGTRADPTMANRYFAAAVELAKAPCDANDETACHILGLAALNGRAGEVDPARATVLLQRACDLGAAGACLDLGDGFANGQDAANAVALWEKGCATGEPRACFRLGKAYDEGNGVGADKARSAQYFKEGCEGGLAEACAYWGAAVWDGKGVKKDSQLAAQLATRACDLKDHAGCTLLGLIMMAGAPGVPKSEAKGVALWTRECSAGYGGACMVLGTNDLQNGPSGEAAAAAWFTKGCEASDGASCWLLGKMVSDGRGGLDWDEARAKELFKRGCQLGDADACASAKGDEQP